MHLTIVLYNKIARLYRISVNNSLLQRIYYVNISQEILPMKNYFKT